tara:strand:- start:63 stop:629 length:567 start_codon:yes stop_codon:yes gene_type:complete
MGRRKINKKEKILRYILKNRTASVKQVAEATGASTKYVYTLKSQSGTPKEVIEKELNVQPVVTETFKGLSGATYQAFELRDLSEKPEEPKERIRTTTLQEAESLVSGDREEEHGEFWKNAYLTSRLWQGYTGWDIQPEQVPVMLALLKIARSVGARQQESSGKDNFVDACGYLALAAELDQFDPEDID